jgi:hypothetical protein
MFGTSQSAQKTTPTTNSLTNSLTIRTIPTQSNIRINPHAHQSNTSRFTPVQQPIQQAPSVPVNDIQDCITENCSGKVKITKKMLENAHTIAGFVIPNKCWDCYQEKKRKQQAQAFIPIPAPVASNSLELELQTKELEIKQLQAQLLRGKLESQRQSIHHPTQQIQTTRIIPQQPDATVQINPRVIDIYYQHIRELNGALGILYSNPAPSPVELKWKEHLDKLFKVPLHLLTPIQHNQISLMLNGKRYCQELLRGQKVCKFQGQCKSSEAHLSFDEFKNMQEIWIQIQAYYAQQAKIQSQAPIAHYTAAQLFQMEERKAGRLYCGSELKNSDGCSYKDKCQNGAVHFKKAQEPKTIPICHAERDHGKCKKADCKYSHTSSPILTSAQEVKHGFELLTELDNEITPAEITPIETIPIEIIPAEIIPAETIPAETIPAETIPIEPAPIKPAPIERINAHQDVKTQLLPKKTRRGWGN